MSCFGEMKSFVGFLGRLVLILVAVSFLFKTIGWIQLPLALLSTKTGSNANLEDTKLANWTRFNPYSLSMLMTSIILLTLAIYSSYVSIFSKRRGMKRLAYTSMLVFFSGLILCIWVSPLLSRMEDNALNELTSMQPMYNWKSGQNLVGVSSISGKQATIVWDLVQENLECCGMKSPDDWSVFQPASSQLNLLPRSCCYLASESIQGDDNCRTNLPHWTSGCSQQVHLIFTQLISMIYSVTYHCMLICMLASIVAVCSSYDEAGPWESMGIARQHHESLFGGQKYDALLVTEQQTYIYPSLSQIPVQMHYVSH